MAAVRPSAFQHHHRSRCRSTSHGSCIGCIPTSMPSLRRRWRRRRRQQVVNANRAWPVWPGTIRPGPRTGPGPGSDRVRLAPAAALSAYSKLDLHTLLYSQLIWQKRAAFLSSKFCFIAVILGHCYCYYSHCYCRGIVIVVIVIVGAFLL
jgi:hypothetical protein